MKECWNSKNALKSAWYIQRKGSEKLEKFKNSKINRGEEPRPCSGYKKLHTQLPSEKRMTVDFLLHHIHGV